MSAKIAVISLGCDKNRVDTENMLWYLSKGDFVITDDYASAEIIIINTCAFIESARAEAIDTILEMAQYKTQGACKRLIVTGCLVQKHADELKAGIPEIDAMLGIDEYQNILSCVSEKFLPCEVGCGRVLSTPPHLAYLKISDGCDNFCTFCTIPSIRGRFRSRSIEGLVVEANDLVAKGVKELILVAQDVTGYGKDLYGKPMLVELIRELSKTDVKWIRLMYCYPELVTDELIDELVNNPKLVKYIDIPMQHVSDPVLKRMNRRSSYNQLVSLAQTLKEKSIALRTTFMVGFPGETGEDFKQLLDFVERFKPENLGVFAYSKESGTPSAKLKNHIPKAVKLKRVRELGELNLKNVIERNKALIGQTVEVLYEDVDYERGLFRGRTQYDAPDIDRVVYFTGKFADVGNFYMVRITDYDNYDLIGEIIE